MKRWNTWLEKNMIKILYLFLFLQPFLDVLTSFGIHVLKINVTVGMIVRSLFLLFLGYYFLTHGTLKKKKWMMIYFLFLACYLIGFIVCLALYKNESVIWYELQGLIRTFYFPVLLLLIWHISKDQQNSFSLKQYIVIIFCYILLISIPTMLNVGFDAYTQGKVGSIGWFYSTNEISAILSMFLPYSLLWILQRCNSRSAVLEKIVYSVLLLYVLFSLGTKMTILSLIFVCISFFALFIIKWIKEKKYYLLRFAVSGIVIVLIFGIWYVPKTSFYQNIMIHMNFLGIEEVSDIWKDRETLDHFIFSQRLSFLEETHKNYQDAPSLEKMFGIGYIEKFQTEEENRKLIEMDFFDVFYRHGVIGFFLFILPFFVILGKVCRNTWIKKEKKTEDFCFALSMMIVFFTSSFVGHVLVAPAVSVFVVFLVISQYQKTII